MSKDSFDPETQALHYRVNNAETQPVVTPIYQNSAFSADSPYFYTRKSNPNSVELEGALGILEGAKHVVSCTTGMTAISLALQCLKPGDHLVINELIYGCSYKLFQRFTRQLGIKLSILDLNNPAEVNALGPDVTMVFFETPTNPFLRTISIENVAYTIKSLNPEALVVVDNTWATPLFQKPLDFGADISLASATKFISGHSDVMGGYLALNREDLASQILESRFYHGAILDPNSAWLLRRSLHTLPLRMREHVQITQQLVDYCQTREQVQKVYFPQVDGQQLLAYGGIIFIQLHSDLQQYYSVFSHSLQLFDTGTAMACVSGMVAQPWSGSHASLDEPEKISMGLTPGLVRLCFGLEKAEDLIKDLGQAFDIIQNKLEVSV